MLPVSLAPRASATALRASVRSETTTARMVVVGARAPWDNLSIRRGASSVRRP
jgi:hypothetical protein